jgi:hypothetical protein
MGDEALSSIGQEAGWTTKMVSTRCRGESLCQLSSQYDSNNIFYLEKITFIFLMEN